MKAVLRVLCLCFFCANGMVAESPNADVSDTKTPTFTTFAAPDAGTGTFATAINQAGAVTGWYRDTSNSFHAFLRASNGKITEFDAPGAGVGANGTIPSGINSAGEIAGYYVDATNVNQGFVRAADGEITSFDVQGS